MFGHALPLRCYRVAIFFFQEFPEVPPIILGISAATALPHPAVLLHDPTDVHQMDPVRRCVQRWGVERLIAACRYFGQARPNINPYIAWSWRRSDAKTDLRTVGPDHVYQHDALQQARLDAGGLFRVYVRGTGNHAAVLLLRCRFVHPGDAIRKADIRLVREEKKNAPGKNFRE